MNVTGDRVEDSLLNPTSRRDPEIIQAVLAVLAVLAVFVHAT